MKHKGEKTMKKFNLTKTEKNLLKAMVEYETEFLEGKVTERDINSLEYKYCKYIGNMNTDFRYFVEDIIRKYTDKLI